MSAQGALLFARYAYPPNELGYCGPEGSRALLEREATLEIERRARKFEGAWSYLEFIAAATGIPDPLDTRVVEAYWVGNDLLGQCDPGALSHHLAVRFYGQPGGTWQGAADRAQAHHSFQVFEVYPWARLLASDGHPVALSVLDQCRIRVGVVTGVEGENATVRSAPLLWGGSQFEKGSSRLEQVRWSTDGRSLLDGLSPGDRVSLHWDWVCDVVTQEQATSIESREASQLAVLAGLRTPPPVPRPGVSGERGLPAS